MKFWQHKAAGSSLIETITAMIIISMVFAMAVTIYLNVYKSNGQFRKMQADLAIDDRWVETQQANDYTEKSWPYETFTLFRLALPAADSKELRVIRFEIRDEDGRLLAERKFLRYVAP